jgi:hypothetical protein
MPTAYQEFLETLQAKPDPDRGAQYFATCAGCVADYLSRVAPRYAEPHVVPAATY